MHLQLGEFSAVVVTSSEMAKQVVKTHDFAFASRPKFMAMDIICYGRCYIALTPYREYWRQMRKICVMVMLIAFGQVVKEQDVFIKLIREVVISLAEDLGVTDIFTFHTSSSCFW